MDFRHIRAFIAVAEAMSVTKAAERLHISQPPLSRHIHQLEQEIGVTLFVRHRQGVTLTDAGRRLLDKARQLDAAASDFWAAARDTRSREVQRVRLGIAWGLWDMVNRVRVEFTRRHPDVTIEATDAFCYYDSDELLRTKAIDLAFARGPFDPAFAVSAPVVREPIQAIFSDASPLAARDSVSIRELAREPLLLWDRQAAPLLFDQILDLYARASVSPPMVPTPNAGPFNHAGMLLVASGKGVYLGYGVPHTGAGPVSGVAVRPVSDPEATVDICLVSRKGDQSRALSQFIECVWQVFPQHAAVAS